MEISVVSLPWNVFLKWIKPIATPIRRLILGSMFSLP